MPTAKPKDKKDSATSPASALPADLADAQHGPGTSTSTGGATATRNTGAATGGAVTITISGSSSTSTSTETSTETSTTTGGAGKGAAAGGKGAAAGKGPSKGASDKTDTGDKRPHVYNITVNSTGRSGDAVDSDETKHAPAPVAAKKKQAALSQGLSGLSKPGKNAAPKVSDQK